MASAFQWIELILTHKGIIISLFAVLVGSNGYQFWDRDKKSEVIKNTEAAVTHLAENINRTPSKVNPNIIKRLKRLEEFH